MALIEFNNFSFAYMNSDGSESQVKSLDNINLEIDYGDFVLLCGPSGCGKTTLLTNLKKELMPAGRRAGEILQANFSEHRGRMVGCVPSTVQRGVHPSHSCHFQEQCPDQLWWSHFCCWSILLFGRPKALSRPCIFQADGGTAEIWRRLCPCIRHCP